MASSVASGSLTPPGPKKLDPVVGGRVVAGRDDHAEGRVQRPGQGRPRRGVGMTPSLSTSTPALASPATTAASRNSPEARGSRPTTATGARPGPGLAGGGLAAEYGGRQPR